MANRKAKESIVAVPGIGYIIRLASNIVRLPKLRDQLTMHQQSTDAQLAAIQQTQQEIAKKLDEQSTLLNNDISSVQMAYDNLRAQLNSLAAGGAGKKSASSTTDSELFADDHLMDSFYTAFEDKFRGSEEMISERLEEYLPYFTESKLNFKKTPVLDIGSGRGELLSLLKQHKINAIGLDINHDMVKRSQDKGLQAVQGDALTYLQAAKPQSLGAITGFHLVEHIPFNTLLRIFKAAHRTLENDGFVIFETPNPENIIVGTHNFYMDPSHLHPLPPTLLAFALETCGFKKVEIKRLHPDTEGSSEGLPPKIAERFYGPRDYAVIGYK
jgi:O-antigen chain-terminating methyltransferase